MAGGKYALCSPQDCDSAELTRLIAPISLEDQRQHLSSLERGEDGWPFHSRLLSPSSRSQRQVAIRHQRRDWKNEEQYFRVHNVLTHQGIRGGSWRKNCMRLRRSRRITRMVQGKIVRLRGHFSAHCACCVAGLLGAVLSHAIRLTSLNVTVRHLIQSH